MDIIENKINEILSVNRNIDFDDIPTHLSNNFKKFLEYNNINVRLDNLIDIYYVDISDNRGYISFLSKNRFNWIVGNDIKKYIHTPLSFRSIHIDDLNKYKQQIRVGRLFNKYTNLSKKEIEDIVNKYKIFQDYIFSNQ